MSGFNKKRPFKPGRKPLSDLPGITGNIPDTTRRPPTREEFFRNTDWISQLGNWINNGDDGQGVTSETASMGSLLEMLNLGGQSGGNIYQSLATYLLSMSQNGNITSEIRDQIRTFLFQLLANQDQRQFDISQLQDSRLYNSPTNELARMMGAGISRDAAIQMLSGSAGNIGGVAGSMGAAAPAVHQTSGTQALQQQQFGVETAQAAVNMLSQLVNTGVSLAQGVESVKGMQSANAMTQAQMQGFSSANDLANAIQSLQANGVLESSEIEKLSNGQDLVNYLQKLAPDNEQIAQLVQSNAYKGTFGSIYGREFFNNHWDSIRKTRDSGTIADEYINGLRVQNALTEANVGKVSAEMSLIGKQEAEIDQKIIESTHRVAQIDADIQVKNKQGEWIKIQTDNYQRLVDSEINLNYSNANLADANAYNADIQGKMLSQEFELNSAGFPMLKDAYILKCKDEFDKWSYLRGDALRDRQATWLADASNARIAAYLEQTRLNAVGGFAARNPGLWSLVSVFNYTGGSDLVRTGTDAVGGAAGFFNAAKKAGSALKFIP